MRKEISSFVPFTAALLTLTLLTPNAGAIDKNAGTSGAQFLKIGAGARPTGMGDAFVGIADDVNAVYFNPAGLSNINQPELTAMHTQWIQDMNYQFGAFAYPTDLGAIAVSASTLKVDDLQRRNTDESYQGSFDAMDSAYALTYAKNISPLLAWGLTGRYIQQEIDTTSAGTWGGDVGVLKRLGRYPLSIGFAIRHLGQSVQFKNESDPLPLTYDLGLGANLFQEKVILGFNIKKPRDNKYQLGLGSEYKLPLGSEIRLAARAGYSTGRSEAEASGLTLGAGLGFKRFTLDFGWVPFGDLGNTFRYAASVKF